MIAFETAAGFLNHLEQLAALDKVHDDPYPARRLRGTAMRCEYSYTPTDTALGKDSREEEGGRERGEKERERGIRHLIENESKKRVRSHAG